VLIDGGGPVEGYQSDISRTFVFGKASDNMRKFLILCIALKPPPSRCTAGVECQAVDARRA